MRRYTEVLPSWIKQKGAAFQPPLSLRQLLLIRPESAGMAWRSSMLAQLQQPDLVGYGPSQSTETMSGAFDDIQPGEYATRLQMRNVGAA